MIVDITEKNSASMDVFLDPALLYLHGAFTVEMNYYPCIALSPASVLSFLHRLKRG